MRPVDRNIDKMKVGGQSVIVMTIRIGRRVIDANWGLKLSSRVFNDQKFDRDVASERKEINLSHFDLSGYERYNV